METTISATENPDLVNQLASQLQQVDSAKPPVPDDLYELPETSVLLPGGLLTFEGELVRDAEVRELTGEDEEALAKQTSPGKVLLAILERGTVSIGGKRATRKMLDDLLTGDRDTLLLAIRRATFGDEVTMTARCSECGEFSDFEINLKDDIPVKSLDSAADRNFSVQCRAGLVEVCLPNGAVQRELMSSADKSLAEINTILLAGSVQSVNGFPSVGQPTVRRLGMRDRETITVELAERNPGPQMDDVSKACDKCGGDARLSLSLASLFRL